MNGYQAYQQMETQTAAPGDLLLMLYRGAIRFVANAIVGIEEHDIQKANQALLRAQAIVSELIDTLDVERGGEVGQQLLALYQYFQQRLIEANVRKDPVPAKEVLNLLRELLPAWETAVKDMRAQTASLAHS